jgi:hypothetical protein
MSERVQAARAELLRLIERYVRPVNLGQQAYVKLSAAMDEVHDAAVAAAHEALGVVKLLESDQGPAAAVVAGDVIDAPGISELDGAVIGEAVGSSATPPHAVAADEAAYDVKTLVATEMLIDSKADIVDNAKYIDRVEYVKSAKKSK